MLFQIKGIAVKKTHQAFWKAKGHPVLEFGKKVIYVCEAYTSKTVSWTGEVKNVE